MKKLNVIELLKSLSVTILAVIITIIASVWKPITMTLLKTVFITSLIYVICQTVPHGIVFLSNISLLGWLVIVVLYRLITFKYSDFDEEETVEKVDDGPIELNDEVLIENEEDERIVNALPKNVVMNFDTNKYSTRE